MDAEARGVAPMIAVNATQCISCGHVSAPASQLYQCDACGSFDLHVFMAETDEIEVMLAPLPGSAEAKLLAAIEAEERWTLTTLGEGACDTDFLMAVYGWSYEGRVYHVVKGPVAGAVHHETPGCWRLTCCGERWIDIIVDREPRDRVPCPHGG